jgi:predicted amidophosphoribosyltransferase
MQDDALAVDEEPSWPSDSSGAVASMEVPVADLYRCPQCKSPILLDQIACANCGAPIENTESFVDLTPEATSKKTEENSFASQATRNPFLSVALSQIGAQLSGQV